ncbi:MAG: hypothetical protein KJ939_03205 [Nanoarchaeota archaeon]|nr:hypothetical protein [Nanoarchaeota archaeon]MBU4352067.1 hypothetical protein [Nanoarchaeota archaeon]
MKEQTKGRIVSTLVPETFLLGTKLGDWYEKNPHHRFDEGDILILKNGEFGYGIRPVAVVNGYEVKEDSFGKKAGKYDITMYRDEQGDFFQWMRQNEVPQGVERIVGEHEIHFKWNIENQFKKVPVNSVDEALALYASREVEQQEIKQ